MSAEDVGSIIGALMARGETRDEARRLLKHARELVAEGSDPEEVLYEELGLEPDYMEELY